MTEEELKKVEQAFKHGDTFVFQLEGEVYVTESYRKIKKTGMIKLNECYKIDNTCFEKDGSYNGDTCETRYDMELIDPYPLNKNIIASIYYNKDVVKLLRR